MKTARSLWHLSSLAYFSVDTILCGCGVLAAEFLSPKLAKVHAGDVFYTLGLAGSMAVALYMIGLQRTASGFRSSEVITKVLLGTIVGAIAFATVVGLIQFQLIGRYVLGLSILYSTAFVTGSRLMLWRLAERTKRKILLYGSSAAYAEIVTSIKEWHLPIEFVHYGALESRTKKMDPAIPLLDTCLENQIAEVVVERPEDLQALERSALLHCTIAGMTVVDLAGFYERHLQRVYIGGLRDAWFWSYDPAHVHPIYLGVKRAMDVIVSVLGIVVTLPLYPLLFILLKVQDGGPLIYSQVRSGRRDKPFTILKFRTMRMDAEARGPLWAAARDVRVTFVGRMLRKTRIDEVPQFWNILKGEMSFVGPRPERPEFVLKLDREINYYRYRHLITPGLTGWAQINYPYGASIDDAREKLSYDLYYMKYASITLDLLIILRTLAAMIRGAR